MGPGRALPILLKSLVNRTNRPASVPADQGTCLEPGTYGGMVN
jgi:hypothetical protein